MTTVTMRAPAALIEGAYTGKTGTSYQIDASGLVSLNVADVVDALNAGFRFYRQEVKSTIFESPIAADLVSVKVAAAPANGAIVIAGQPDEPRKLQVRVVIDTTHAITAGKLTLVGTNPQGQAVTEDVSLITAASATIKTANAYAHVASGAVSGLVATGGVGADTLGIGVAADLGLPLSPNFIGLTVFKENVDSADEAVGTVDQVAGTISPTTAPNAAHLYDFWYVSGIAD